MKVSTHMILAVIAYFILQNFFGVKFALIFAISSVIVDIDHWFWAVYKAKKWWLHEAYFWNLEDIKRMRVCEARGRKVKSVLHVFHTIEFILIALVAGLFLPVLLPAFWGIIFHFSCDMLQTFIEKTHGRRKLSLFQNS
ncbi:MAG: hypothetical protein QXM31_01365 [Candidatus Woesearchaeota archaeon]